MLLSTFDSFLLKISCPKCVSIHIDEDLCLMCLLSFMCRWRSSLMSSIAYEPVFNTHNPGVLLDRNLHKKDCCYQGSYSTRGYQRLSWSNRFESFTVAIMTWLSVTEINHAIFFYCSSCTKPRHVYLCWVLLPFFDWIMKLFR
jgi:hypothetical protein